MPEWRVRASSPGDVDEAANALSRAMVTNPNQTAIWKGEGEGERRRQQALMAMMLARTQSADLFVAESDGQIIGAMRMVESSSCQMSKRQSLAMLPRILATQRATTPRVLSWLGTWARHDPEERHLHLGPIAVVPEQQGHGVGSDLMGQFLERVGRDGLGSYLETDRPENVGYYECFGFVATGEDQVHGVDNWFMWRDAET